ncbi:hypothetical protein BDE02_09G016300 [Populus trichocarpa]|nr:hypothetical protein BDE02_09G016300 [Populus trichocarpa]
MPAVLFLSLSISSSSAFCLTMLPAKILFYGYEYKCMKLNKLWLMVLLPFHNVFVSLGLYSICYCYIFGFLLLHNTPVNLAKMSSCFTHFD